MKKLLLLATLATMTTTALAVNPGKDTVTKAEVLVKAEVVEDFFKITDIDGNPLVLDFKKLPKRDYTKDMAKTYVEYKITGNAPAETTGITLNMNLTSYTSPDNNSTVNTVEIINENIATTATDKDKITVNLALDSATKTIGTGETTAVGRINGAINSNLSTNNTGLYSGKVFLMAKVQ